MEDGKQKKQNQKKEKPKKEKSELPQKEKQAIAVSGDTPVKTKAELKAERRALQVLILSLSNDLMKCFWLLNFIPLQQIPLNVL